MTYIDPAGKVFAHLDRVAGWRAGQTPAPVTIEIDLSNRCDLGCAGCHFAHTHTRGPWSATAGRSLPVHQDRGGDLADTALILRLLREAATIGVRGVVWSGGGEPTLHPEWRLLVSEAADAGLEQGMYTHGGLLDRASAPFLADLASWVVVSLDAVDAASYSTYKRVPSARFEAACHGVRWMTDRAAVVGVSFLLSEANWIQAPRMLELARELGATYATFRPLIETSPSAPGVVSTSREWIEIAEPLLLQLAAEPDVELSVQRFRAYRDWSAHGYTTCQGPTLTTTITPDGRVWVCPNRREFAGSCLGDLKQESFAAIWSRHPGRWLVDQDCRAMCRLHTVNRTLEALDAPRVHAAFI